MDTDDLHFYNPWEDVEVSQNHLPHWQQPREGGPMVYFVTWRQADSIPKAKLDEHFEERRMWLEQNPEPWDEETEAQYHRLFSARMDEWMDAGHGSCLLRDPANAKIVEDRLSHFEGTRTAMLSFVAMPNHVHVLFALHGDWRLEGIVKGWKGVSARKINRRENRTSSNLWQKDYFDRLVRDRRHFGNCVRYIRKNPEKAKLSKGEYLLWECAITREIE